MLGSLVSLWDLMAFQVAIPTSTVATQACVSTFFVEYWSPKCLLHLSVLRWYSMKFLRMSRGCHR
jgi:hypothetical protein